MGSTIISEALSNPEAARQYFQERRWPDGVRCPACGSDRVTARTNGKHHGFFECQACRPRLVFSVRTGTVMERSQLPLHKWAKAIQVLEAQPAITCEALAAEIETTNATAWSIRKRLREAGGLGTNE